MARLSELHEVYLSSLSKRRCSRRTIEAYAADFAVFLEFLDDRDDLEGLQWEQAAGYLSWLGERKQARSGTTRGYSPSTIRRRIASASAFCDWLVRCRYLDRNPFYRIARPSRPRSLHRGIPVEWLDAVFALPDLTVLERALLGVLRYCGLRVSELISLSMRDIDLLTDSLIVRGEIGEEDRSIPLDPKLSLLLRVYLDHRGNVPPMAPLFPGRRVDKLSAKAVGRILSSLASRAGVPRFTTRQIRHAFATEAIKTGVPLEMLQEILGHKSIETTDLYRQTLRVQVRPDVREAMNRLHAWRQRQRGQGPDAEREQKA